jgi:hypothetical protein
VCLRIGKHRAQFTRIRRDDRVRVLAQSPAAGHIPDPARALLTPHPEGREVIL